MEQSQPGVAIRRAGIGQIALLVLGDCLAFLVFAAIGRRSHGYAAGFDALIEVAGTAAPFILGWFIVAPFAGAFRPLPEGPRGEVIGAMAGRTLLAWALACPLGLLLRALILWREIPPSFAAVTFITNLIILGGWRLLFSLIRRP